MSTHDSDAPPGRRPSAAQIERACHPTRRDRALTALGWYTPELTAAGVAAGAAATVWAPLGLISVVLAGRILADRVSIARRNRKVAAERATSPTDGTTDTASRADTGEQDHHEDGVA